LDTLLFDDFIEDGNISKYIIGGKSMESDKKTTSLKDIYCEIQKEMIAADFRKVLRHPTDKGDRIENTWISWFRNYLPKRYQAARATVIDSKGYTSQQIDVVLYDAQYTYMALNDGDGILYIPAESVYAVFEVKPNLTTDHMKYMLSLAVRSEE
jgi:hypothetical protein